MKGDRGLLFFSCPFLLSPFHFSYSVLKLFFLLVGCGLEGGLLGGPLLGQAVEEHTGDGHERTEGGHRGELGLEDDDGRRDEEHALEGVTHGVGHGVDDAQATESDLVCFYFIIYSFFGSWEKKDNERRRGGGGETGQGRAGQNGAKRTQRWADRHYKSNNNKKGGVGDTEKVKKKKTVALYTVCIRSSTRSHEFGQSKKKAGSLFLLFISHMKKIVLPTSL